MSPAKTCNIREVPKVEVQEKYVDVPTTLYQVHYQGWGMEGVSTGARKMTDTIFPEVPYDKYS